MTIAIAEEASGAVPAGVKSEMLGVGTSLLDALLGYLVVFIGLVLLMVVVITMGKIITFESIQCFYGGSIRSI